MDLTMLPLVYAQAQPAAANPGSLYSLALRRWCSSLTLSSPQSVPSLHGLWAFLAGLGALLILAILLQGPSAALKQFFDVAGHARLVQKAARRVWRGGRMVSIAIGFTVVSWTASQAWVFTQESRRLDLLMLTRSRGPGELAIEHGILAALTPLRDVAGLADNLPLLIIAVIVVFRASFDLPGWGGRLPDYEVPLTRVSRRSGWATLVWGCAALYALYRVVARLAGSTDLPLGNCLVIEALLIPVLMLASDGILLAWLLTELRNAGLEVAGEDRLDTWQAIALMPGAALACATGVACPVPGEFCVAGLGLSADLGHGDGGWELRPLAAWLGADRRAGGRVVGLGAAGAVAWSRGTIRGAIAGYERLLSAEGGHLVAVVAMAGVAAGLVTAAAYAVVLLLPVQSWVLAAADSYAHFATLPVGLWALAAFIELAERSLPTASIVRPATRKVPTEINADGQRSGHLDARPQVATPTP